MRKLIPLALALLLGGCALPFGLQWPRMPWHKPRPKPEYCVVSLETGSGGGIGSGGDTVQLACQAQPNTRPPG